MPSQGSSEEANMVLSNARCPQCGGIAESFSKWMLAWGTIIGAAVSVWHWYVAMAVGAGFLVAAVRALWTEANR